MPEPVESPLYYVYVPALQPIPTALYVVLLAETTLTVDDRTWTHREWERVNKEALFKSERTTGRACIYISHSLSDSDSDSECPRQRKRLNRHKRESWGLLAARSLTPGLAASLISCDSREAVQPARWIRLTGQSRGKHATVCCSRGSRLEAVRAAWGL
jgi:hypothetical protein